MYKLLIIKPNNSYKHKEQYKPKSEPKKKKALFLFSLLLFTAIATIFILNQYKGTDFIIIDDDGNAQLSTKRQEKLQKKLEELDNAIQYVLRAKSAGIYPCYNCINSTTIYLYPLEVWKYGVTTKGEEGRYPKEYLEELNVFMEVQFEGNIYECGR